MNTRPFEFITDTATLCVYDLEALKHRLNDDADWWCWPAEAQLQELNAGNAVFLDLGSDGTFRGDVSTEPLTEYRFQAFLACPSGKLFVGAGEEATSEGMEPDCTRGGIFVIVPRGFSVLQIGRSSEGQLHLAVRPHDGPPKNEFTKALSFVQNAA
jgi:hypothetical protein